MAAFPRKRLTLGIGVVTLAILASVLSLALVGLGAATASAPRPYVDRHVENGDWAWVGATLPMADPNVDRSACWLNVNVDRSGTPRATQTNLYYDVSQWDPNAEWEGKDGIIYKGACVPAEGGSGVIPNGAYRVTGQIETLTFDTSTLPVSDRWSGAGGVISLTWQKTSSYESRHSGVDSYRTPTSSWTRTGRWSDSSATATGTVIGRAVDAKGDDSGGASVGSSNGVSICRSADPDSCFGGK